MNLGWLCKLSTVITHVNYTKMVATLIYKYVLHDVNGMMSKHWLALEYLRGLITRGKRRRSTCLNSEGFLIIYSAALS